MYCRVLPVHQPGARIIGARAEAWLLALAETGLALVERDAGVRWRATPSTVISRADRAVPRAAGALPLVIARSRIADIDDAGVTIGVGDPAIGVAWLPFCGCDACDDGSQAELDRLDDLLAAITTGRFRRLIRPSESDAFATERRAFVRSPCSAMAGLRPRATSVAETSNRSSPTRPVGKSPRARAGRRTPNPLDPGEPRSLGLDRTCHQTPAPGSPVDMTADRGG